MPYYVYMYVHPEHPCLYVGKTADIDARLASHASSKHDNIDREYEDLISQATVYYTEVGSPEEGAILEEFLIRKHSPHLNKQYNHKKAKITLNMVGCNWKKYGDDSHDIEEECDEDFETDESNLIKLMDIIGFNIGDKLRNTEVFDRMVEYAKSIGKQWLSRKCLYNMLRDHSMINETRISSGRYFTRIK